MKNYAYEILEWLSLIAMVDVNIKKNTKLSYSYLNA